MTKKIIMRFIFACLLPVFIGYASEPTSPQKASPVTIINGQVLGATTLKPIKNAEIQIGIREQYPVYAKEETYVKCQITDEEGRYSFDKVPFAGKYYTLSFKLKKSEGYADFSCEFYVSKEDSEKPVLTYNFKVMKPTDEVTVRVKALNVVDKTPLNKIVLKLQKYSREKAQFVDFKEGLTDEKGNYEVKIPWGREDDDTSSLKYLRLGVGGNDYSISINEVRYRIERNVTDQKIETTDGYSEYSGNLYLLDSKKTPTVNCVLTNNDGKPLVDVPITVKLGEIT